jgi:hypothetical protein
MSFSLADERESLFPASKILSMQSLIMNQELRFYILADGNLANFDIFHLIDPSRVVVDLMGVRTTETPDVWTLSGPMVSKIKISLNEDKVRVVFRLLIERDFLIQSPLRVTHYEYPSHQVQAFHPHKPCRHEKNGPLQN